VLENFPNTTQKEFRALFVNLILVSI
jgi:hypothetical protein